MLPRFLHDEPFNLCGGEVAFRSDDLFQRAAKVDGSGSGALVCSPWNRGTESIVDLEGSGAVTKARELATVS